MIGNMIDYRYLDGQYVWIDAIWALWSGTSIWTALAQIVKWPLLVCTMFAPKIFKQINFLL